MLDWGIALLLAVGASAVTILIREGVEWWRRPRLKIDFEEVNGQKPYIHDLLWESGGVEGKTARIRLLRLNVQNAGRKPAMDCESKMVIFKDRKKEPYSLLLHWTRRDHLVYETPDKYYAPISINKSDDETLDLFKLHYYSEDAAITQDAKIESWSHRTHGLERNVPYIVKVTVYASNTVSNPFVLKLCWDGTLEGFSRAVQKAEESEYVQNL